MRTLLLLVVVLLVLLPACTPDGQGGPPSMEVTVETRTVTYGEHPDQHLTLSVPSPGTQDTTIVLLHGGFWRQRYRADLMEPLRDDLVERGYVVANVEYRRVGGAGGWPATLDDVAAALDALAEQAEVDPDAVITVGHSAGGHLAVWAASRHRLPAGAPGVGPRVRPCAAIAQAGVVDLAAAADARLGNGAVAQLLGGQPEAVPDRYGAADPARLLPIGVPVVLIHGRGDTVVPVEISRRYLEQATAAGDPARLEIGDGDHFDVIDPDHPLWASVLEALQTVCR